MQRTQVRVGCLHFFEIPSLADAHWVDRLCGASCCRQPSLTPCEGPTGGAIGAPATSGQVVRCRVEMSHEFLNTRALSGANVGETSS
jgi:hypothetical protein